MSAVLWQIHALGHSCTGTCICTKKYGHHDINPECPVMRGHSNWVTRVEFSDDGTQVISGSDGSTRGNDGGTVLRAFRTFRLDSSPPKPDTWRFRRTSIYQVGTSGVQAACWGLCASVPGMAEQG